MAKLLAYYSLCPINDVKEFMGFSRDAESGCVINTLGRNIVLIVKLSNQKQLSSWTVLDRLTSKVVYDFKTEKYIGVFANRYVRCWTKDQDDINKVKRIKFSRNILDMFTLADGNTLVLYEDGTCESFESALESRGADKTKPKPIFSEPLNISKVSVLIANTGDKVLTYFVTDPETNSIELHYALLENESLKAVQSFRKIKVDRPEQNVKLVGYTVVDGSGNPSLLSIWSDRRIFMQQLKYDISSSDEQQSNGNFIAMLSMVNVDQPLSVIGINKDCIAVYGNNNNLDGATLFLYNTQFKVIQSKQYFKIYFKNSRFWLCENNILLACGQVLAVVPFRISKEQLSDMIGSQRFNPFTDFVDIESINEDCEYDETYTYDCSVNSVQPFISKPLIPWKRFGPQIYENPERPDKNLRRLYRENMLVDVVEDESLPADTVQVKLISNVDNELGQLILSEHFEVLVSEFEKFGTSETEISDKLVPILIETNATADIGKFLKRYQNVSEKSLANILKYALELPSNRPKKEKEEKVKEANIVPSKTEVLNKNVFLKKENKNHVDLLNVILSCSFNRPSMLPYLRNELSISSVMILLKHLYHLLIDPTECLTDTPVTSEQFDNDEKVIEWVTLIIDSHYQQFVLSRDAEVIAELLRWQEIVERHTNLLLELKTLQPIVQSILEKKFVENEKKFSKWYSIDAMQLY